MSVPLASKFSQKETRERKFLCPHSLELQKAPAHPFPLLKYLCIYNENCHKSNKKNKLWLGGRDSIVASRQAVLSPIPHVAPEPMTTLRSLASMLSPQISWEIGSEGKMVCVNCRPRPSLLTKGCLIQSKGSHFNSET